LFNATNGYVPRIDIKREKIASRVINLARKRYMLLVHDNEGVRYAEPKLSMTGVEAIKSSTPMICRNAMKELFMEVLLGTEKSTQEYIHKFEKTFQMAGAEDKAFPRSVSSVNSYMDKVNIYKKGTPINSRAAILYNMLLKDHGVESQYEVLHDGDKMKYIYLKKPNTLKEDIIGFSSVLPKEFDLHKYIDNDLQFKKTFLDPILPILNTLGWKVEDDMSLDDFFA